MNLVMYAVNRQGCFFKVHGSIDLLNMVFVGFTGAGFSSYRDFYQHVTTDLGLPGDEVVGQEIDCTLDIGDWVVGNGQWTTRVDDLTEFLNTYDV